MKKWIVLGIALAVLLGAAGGAWWYFLGPGSSPAEQEVIQITLNGDRVTLVDYGEIYQEPGAQGNSTLLGEVPVEIRGTVDSGTLGDYMLTYFAQGESGFGTAHRRVRVVDREAPVIQLTADPERYTLPGHVYEEEGFTAKDNHDGDLTDQVVRTETETEITYAVTDSSGNRTVVTRNIVYNDPIPPTLTLEGEASITLIQGASYQEPGYHASDNCDGDLTDRVQVSGSVSTDQPGTYTLEYTVADSYGNQASATRTVVVKEKPKPKPPTPVTGSGGVIYLTFDDGPSKNTSRLLDVLDKYGVKATFFVVNTGYGSVIARAAAAGHTIGIHSATHNYKQIYASEEAYFEDLYKMQGLIESYTGQTATLIRFPGGSSNTVSRFNPGIMTRLTQEVEARGFHYFDWNVASGDAGEVTTADAVYYNVINGVSKRKTSVVLQHDSKSFSVDAVERIIQWGLANGYTFLPLTEDSPGAHHRIFN